jgi:hypothetical protein
MISKCSNRPNFNSHCNLECNSSALSLYLVKQKPVYGEWVSTISVPLGFEYYTFVLGNQLFLYQIIKCNAVLLVFKIVQDALH